MPLCRHRFTDLLMPDIMANGPFPLAPSATSPLPSPQVLYCNHTVDYNGSRGSPRRTFHALVGTFFRMISLDTARPPCYDETKCLRPSAHTRRDPRLVSRRLASAHGPVPRREKGVGGWPQEG